MGVNAKRIIQSIVSSKKYQGLYPKTIERIVLDCLKKYPEKECEKKARNLLHQVWGAYWQGRPNFKSLLENFKKDVKAGKSPKQNALPLLHLQSSTKERIPILDEFYSRILAITGAPESITEHGCGLNPLTWFWMEPYLSPKTRYSAFDIDIEQTEFLKSVFQFLKIPRVKIKLGDVLTDKFAYADIAFFLKFLPLLEKTEKNKTLEILKNQACKYLVVSFPTKSISGKQKGMVDFYSKQFHDLIRNQPWKTEKVLFPTELVFVIKK